MNRFFDISFSLACLVLLTLPLVIIYSIVCITSKGPALYWSSRFGKENLLFQMPKFRTMKQKTPELASHLLGDPSLHYTSVGRYLRKYSIDELPQLYSIIKGDMSLVGPRPALYNQTDLIEMRRNLGIHLLKPGITGWAQVNGRDSLSIEEKVQYDEEYLRRASMGFDIYIIWLTFIKVIKKDGISH
tara:strand:- start:608 stop:1168 length:561 start_codon:yes stop_codon:yes gene_type:complete